MRFWKNQTSYACLFLQIEYCLKNDSDRDCFKLEYYYYWTQTVSECLEWIIFNWNTKSSMAMRGGHTSNIASSVKLGSDEKKNSIQFFGKYTLMSYGFEQLWVSALRFCPATLSFSRVWWMEWFGVSIIVCERSGRELNGFELVL